MLRTPSPLSLRPLMRHSRRFTVNRIAWYEQKAVIVLLALLYLGVKNIHLGPTLPAFLSPNVAKVLVENFGTMEDDLNLFFPEA